MGDVMLFGVLEMPPELWHDDSPIDRAQRYSRYKQAAQRIRDDEEKLAAKDREIAELRERVTEQQESVDQAVALVEYLEGHSKGAMAERVRTALSAGFAQERSKYISNLRNEHYDLQGEHTEALALLGAWQQRAQQAESERDEARECVKWMVGDLQRIATFGNDDARTIASAALAATPEHLRK